MINNLVHIHIVCWRVRNKSNPVCELEKEQGNFIGASLLGTLTETDPSRFAKPLPDGAVRLGSRCRCPRSVWCILCGMYRGPDRLINHLLNVGLAAGGTLEKSGRIHPITERYAFRRCDGVHVARPQVGLRGHQDDGNVAADRFQFAAPLVFRILERVPLGNGVAQHYCIRLKEREVQGRGGLFWEPSYDDRIAEKRKIYYWVMRVMYITVVIVDGFFCVQRKKNAHDFIRQIWLDQLNKYFD